MTRLALLCALLTACGPAYEPQTGAYEWSAPLFGRTVSDAPLSAGALRSNVDLAQALLVRSGHLSERESREAFAGLVLKVEDAPIIRNNVGTAALGWYAPDSAIILNCTGESLLHEMLHRLEHRAGRGLTHDGWEERGLYDLADAYRQRMTNLAPDCRSIPPEGVRGLHAVEPS